jgi:cyclohexyl-isocyanide hydratase
MTMIPIDVHVNIGAIVFPDIDQTDFTGPFAVLSRLPNSTFHVLGKDLSPVRDTSGLILTPQKTLAESPPLDVLHIPGGMGQDRLMEDEVVLSFIRRQAKEAKYVFSVCTGALLCGAAGLLKGRRATTHWASVEFLSLLGAIPVNERVVIDGNLITCAGVTAGIDGALRLAAMLRGDPAAQAIQLMMEYAPQPPFDSGTPKTAPPRVLATAQGWMAKIKAARRERVERVASRLGEGAG